MDVHKRLILTLPTADRGKPLQFNYYLSHIHIDDEKLPSRKKVKWNRLHI